MYFINALIILHMEDFMNCMVSMNIEESKKKNYGFRKHYV